MKLRAEQLEEHLQQTLLPAYLVSGDTPLLQQECCDLIRHKVRDQGFTEREVFAVETGFNWHQLLETASNLSLFGDRKLIELRMPTGKPGETGNKILVSYLENPSPDNILLITTGKLDGNAQRSKWFKVFDKMGGFIQVWPIDPRNLPRWINQRMRQLGLKPDQQAVQLLAERVEGNLLAASQEIEKLRILKGNGQVSPEDINELVGNSARYDVFGLVDAALEGNAARSLRMLSGLQAEGTDATIVLWAFTREIRTLYAMARQKEKGIAIGRIIQEYRVWQNRKQVVEACLRRQSSNQLSRFLQTAAHVDQSIKGLRNASPWDGLQDIALGLSGHPTFSPA